MINANGFKFLMSTLKKKIWYGIIYTDLGICISYQFLFTGRILDQSNLLNMNQSADWKNDALHPSFVGLTTITLLKIL